MRSVWSTGAKILTGFLLSAVYAMPQGYTVSAKPGVVNYVEGNAYVNGRPVSAQTLRAVFLSANDVISTDLGKAEVLLTPGVFLRLGNNTQVRMISPALTNTQVEVKQGEAMIEADDIVKDSAISVIDAGGIASIEKNGLYRFNAGEMSAVAVLEGKLQVSLGDRKTDVSKGHEVELGDALKTQKFDPKQSDDLFAWSNIRSEYNAASSYQTARNVNLGNYGGVWGDYGFSGGYNPGWMWNSGFNSWAWLPGNAAFYSPFGFGFYGPGLVAYAPVIYAPIGYGYGGVAGGRQVTPAALNAIAGNGPKTAAVPVNASHPPAIGMVTNSLASNLAARTQAAQVFSSTGFRTASGGTISAGRAAAQFGSSNTGGGHVASASSSNAGFSNGARSSGGFSSASSGGGHSGGGASSGASHR